MKISYIMPVYNGQNNISKAVKSLLNQNVKGEIIVINDGSTDNTKRILDYFSEEINIINLDTRKGAAYCRNLGNWESKGDIIAVCDCDIYYKERGEAIKEFFKKEKKDVFYSALHCRSADDPNKKWQQAAYAWDFKSKCPISHPTVAYRRLVAMECPYHEETIHSDLFEFCLLDMNTNKFEFGGCQNPLMMKIEGFKNRDMKESRKIKKKKYEDYGIKVEYEDE
mgnify:CR=1 FL=1